MANSNLTIVEEAIAAVAQFVALPEPEKTLDGAKRVAAMMDNANKFLAQSSEAILGDLHSSISKDEETKEALKNQMAELKGDSVHLTHRGDAVLQSPDRINKQVRVHISKLALSYILTEDRQGEEESRESTVLTKEPRSEVGKVRMYALP